MQPVTKYVRSGDLHIAYQVVGAGDFDLIYVPGWVSHVELAWEDPEHARFLTRLASFSRLICFDKRGTGLSDRVPEDKLPTHEERMDDLKMVMDAVGSKQAALFGFSEGGNLCALFAARYPERTKALVVFGTFAKRSWSPDYPWAPTPEQRQKEYDIVEREWGREMDLASYVPSRIHDKEFVRRLATYFRRAASPSAAVTLLRMNTQVDIRDILPTISVPTLVMHRMNDRDAHVEEGRFIATHIPGARFIEFEGDDHIPWIGDQESILDQMEEFLTGMKPSTDFDRVPSTILFTDIVGSTELAAKIGDQAWRKLHARHDKLIRQQIFESGGEEIDTTGDGFLIVFDDPGNGIRCAARIIRACAKIGIEVRTGLHSGEVYKVGSDLSGLAVHIAARVMHKADTGEIVVSSAVVNQLQGEDFNFTDKGNYPLKGLPEEWQLFLVNPDSPILQRPK
jgi:class 3 adenylate cyclase